MEKTYRKGERQREFVIDSKNLFVFGQQESTRSFRVRSTRERAIVLCAFGQQFIFLIEKACLVDKSLQVISD